MTQCRRVPVSAEPPVAGIPDYADAFELRLDGPDHHRAEDWVRAGLEQSGAPVRGLIRFVHGRILRFALTDEPGNLLGWRVLASSYDVVHLVTEGPLLRAEIVARHRAPDVVGFSTSLLYRSRITPLLWRVIGPLHRFMAPYLLRRAATRLTTT